MSIWVLESSDLHFFFWNVLTNCGNASKISHINKFCNDFAKKGNVKFAFIFIK